MVRKIGHQHCTGDTCSCENERNAKGRIIRCPNVQSWWDLKWTFLSRQMWDLGTTWSKATDYIFQKHLASDPRADWNIPRQIFLDSPEKKKKSSIFFPSKIPLLRLPISPFCYSDTLSVSAQFLTPTCSGQAYCLAKCSRQVTIPQENLESGSG